MSKKKLKDYPGRPLAVKEDSSLARAYDIFGTRLSYTTLSGFKLAGQPISMIQLLRAAEDKNADI